MYYPITNTRHWIFAFDRSLCLPTYFTVELISGRKLNYLKWQTFLPFYVNTFVNLMKRLMQIKSNDNRPIFRKH